MPKGIPKNGKNISNLILLKTENDIVRTSDIYKTDEVEDKEPLR